jgi:hypothetical protein
LEGFIWKKHTASAFDLFMGIAVSTIAAWAIPEPVGRSADFKKPTTTEVKIFNFGKQGREVRFYQPVDFRRWIGTEHNQRNCENTMDRQDIQSNYPQNRNHHGFTF